MSGSRTRGLERPEENRRPSPSGAELAPRAVPILTYHSLDASRSVISVDPRVFASHMRRLARRGFTGIPLSRLLAAWREDAELPARPVVITFDDGFENFFDCAAPLLTELGFGATVFAVAGYLGRKNDWRQAAEVTRLPLMGMDRLRELARRGFEIGAHSVSHPRLTKLSAEALEREVGDSRRILEDGLGLAVPCFAYPYGALDPAVKRAVGGTYSAACGARLAVARPTDEPCELPRLDMYYFRGGFTHRLLCTRPGAAYLALRGLGRRLRARAGRATPDSLLATKGL
ncbi:MAG: polysaccharide deacetylase family protein [Acidobacteria bacterium]|nr:polysaccharide deacetylase family protein [Acidobacteriota bacterium]